MRTKYDELVESTNNMKKEYDGLQKELKKYEALKAKYDELQGRNNELKQKIEAQQEAKQQKATELESKSAALEASYNKAVEAKKRLKADLAELTKLKTQNEQIINETIAINRVTTSK